jgi:predicted AlkP superfamily phosphohydrolase/phosphomutase
MIRRAPPVLFIGLDSAEPDLLDRWIADGSLPNLAALRARSAWCEATAPRGFGNGVVWPSLYTGVGPATHGRYYFRQMQVGSYDIVEFKEDTGLCRAPFWKAVSAAGRRVGVVDMVRSPLATELNGFQIADWLTHDATGPVRSWPEALAEQTVARFGADPVRGNADRFMTEGATPAQLRDALCARIGAKTLFTREQLEQGKHDLLISVYGEPHDIGHLCWHLHDPTHERHTPSLARRYGDPVHDVYVALDRAIGELLDSADTDAAIVLFSGPGMGPSYTGSYMLDAILRRLEGLDAAREPNLTDALKDAYAKYLPAKWRRRVNKFRGGRRPAGEAESRGARKYFQVPHNRNAGAIRINLRGREPNGRVSPDEYDDVCAELIGQLREVINVDTGRSIVADVVKVREACRGPQRDSLPDLMVIWDRPVPINTIQSERIGRMTNIYRGVRTGDHTPHCVFMLAAAGVQPGLISDPIPVEAIAPTVAALLDVPLPDIDAGSQLVRFRYGASHAVA